MTQINRREVATELFGCCKMVQVFINNVLSEIKIYKRIGGENVPWSINIHWILHPGSLSPKAIVKWDIDSNEIKKMKYYDIDGDLIFEVSNSNDKYQYKCYNYPDSQFKIHKFYYYETRSTLIQMNKKGDESITKCINLPSNTIIWKLYNNNDDMDGTFIDAPDDADEWEIPDYDIYNFSEILDQHVEV